MRVAPTDAFPIRTAAGSQRTGKEGFACTRGPMKQDPPWRSETESLEDLRIEQWEESHFLERVDIYQDCQ
jgi:hypothetical protein